MFPTDISVVRWVENMETYIKNELLLKTTEEFCNDAEFMWK